MNKDIPDILYRYRPMGEPHDLAAVHENYLWFSSSKDFNDPFEFSYTDGANIPNPYTDWSAFEKMNDQIFKIPKPDLVKLMSDGRMLNGFGDFTDYCRKKSGGFYKKFPSNIYCCCFSINNDHVLMWGHYAGGLKGACFGFNVESLSASLMIGETESIRRVSYPNENAFPVIDYLEAYKYPVDSPEFNAVLADNFKRQLCTKSSHWEYEEEYRLLWHEDRGEWNQKVLYNSDSLVEVIFGELMPEEERHTIREILGGPGIAFKEARRSETHYSIDIIDLPQ